MTSSTAIYVFTITVVFGLQYVLMPVNMLTSVLAAFAFVYYDFKYKETIFNGMLLTFFIPITVLVMPNYLLMSKLGLLDTPYGVMLPGLADGMGIFLIRQTMRSIPKPLLIENVGLRTKNNVLVEAEEYLAMFEAFPQACALLDTGHAHVNGWDLAKVVQALGPRLTACHIHDNSGAGDEHLPVGRGTIDWRAYFAAVKEFAPQAAQVLEYSCGFAGTAELERHIAELKETYKL